MKKLKYAAACLVLLSPVTFAQRWAVQYFYDQDETALALQDLAFPSTRRGVAIGTIYSRPGHVGSPKHVALVTSDGGEHWALEPIRESPRSLFFLNDSLGWMVTDKGIWRTEESGRNWQKISGQQRPDRDLKDAKRAPRIIGGLIQRVWFLDAQHGFSVGAQKTVLETHDGGRTWVKVEEASKPAANPAFTAYTRIAFTGPNNGVIMGGSAPPRREDPGDQLPAWMEPEVAVRRRQVPTLMVLLQTWDGGAHWQNTHAPLFGSVASLRLAGNDGLLALEFNESFEWPSEVYRVDLSKGANTRVFREKNRRVTDSALYAGPRGFLAAVEPPGQLNSSPIPGRVKILTSSNLTEWSEMDVNYKAVARSVILAGPDADHMWCGTDTGMILRLTGSQD